MEPRNIIRRSQDAWNSLPVFIKEAMAFPRKTPFEKYVSDSVVLGFRYNEFLLQRAMVKKVQVNNRELLSVAREVFSIVMNLIRNNSGGLYACDLPWIVSLF
jgi:hypothetical protein